MKEYSSKLALNQAVLEKDKAIQEGEVIVVKTYSNTFGEHQTNYLMKKCDICGDLFFQSAYSKHVYVRCEKCGKVKKKEFPKDYK